MARRVGLFPTKFRETYVLHKAIMMITTLGSAKTAFATAASIDKDCDVCLVHLFAQLTTESAQMRINARGKLS